MLLRSRRKEQFIINDIPEQNRDSFFFLFEILRHLSSHSQHDQIHPSNQWNINEKNLQLRFYIRNSERNKLLTESAIFLDTEKYVQAEQLLIVNPT